MSLRSLIIPFPAFFMLTGLMASCPAPSPDGGGIKFFNGTWKEVLAKASAEKKPIFLDIYATWCGPCKLLKRETFVNKEVAKFYNANFINVSLDGEKDDGAILAEQYRIPGYPSLFIFDNQGKPILTTSGFLPAKEFLQFGQDALKRIK